MYSQYSSDSLKTGTASVPGSKWIDLKDTKTLTTIPTLPISYADAEPLLIECDYLHFGIFQRNPVGGTYDQYPAATPATCKLVQLRWLCSRDLIHSKFNTESVQSAKIVIRKQ